MENEIYIVNGEEFSVHPSQKNTFLEKYPNAQPKNVEKQLDPVNVEATAGSENTASKSEVGSSESRLADPRLAGLKAIPIGPAAGATETLVGRKLLGGSLAFLNTIGQIKDSAKATADYLFTNSWTQKGTRAYQAYRRGEITKQEANQQMFNNIDEFFESSDNFFDQVKEIDKVLEDVDRADDVDPDGYFSVDFQEGRYAEGLNKLTDGILDIIPNVVAVMAGGPIGYGSIFTSATGGAYKRKIDAAPSRRGDDETFGWSLAQGAADTVSEVVTRGIFKGTLNQTIGRISPQAVRGVYKKMTENIVGKVASGMFFESTSEIAAQEFNRYIDYVWDEDTNFLRYQNPDGSYNIGDFLPRTFDTVILSSLISAPLSASAPARPLSPNVTPNMRRYTEERLSPADYKQENIKTVEEIARLEAEFAVNPDPIIENRILELQQKVTDNTLLNQRVLNSFDNAELLDYAKDKFTVEQAKENLKFIDDVETKTSYEKAIKREEAKVNETYNSQKAIILMLNFGPNATNAEIKAGVKKSKTNKLADEINTTYNDATSKADWDNTIADQAITKLYGDGENGTLARIIKNKITGEISALPDFSKQDFVSEVTTELIPHIRNFNPEQAAGESKITLSGWINGFIDNKIKNVLKGKKATKEQFETEISNVQETQFDIDNSTQEALDLQQVKTPEQSAKLNEIAGISKADAQSDAAQILTGKLPGILEKTGRDKNEIRTAINNASILKISDKILEEMGGKFTAKEGANNQFASFLGAHYDILFGDNTVIPDYVKNKLDELFKPNQVGRETMVEGDAAGKAKFEYQNPTFDQVLNFYTDETKGLSTLRARKERLADIIAPEIIKNAMAEVLADPSVQKDFLDRQRFQKKDIPQDAIPKFLQRIDRTIESLESSLQNQTFQMDITGGLATGAYNMAKVVALRILKGVRKLLGNNIDIKQASEQTLSEIAQEMNLSPEQAQVFIEGIGTLTLQDLTEGKLSPKVELGLNKAVTKRLEDQSRDEINLINNLPESAKENALVNFFFGVAPTYQKSSKRHKLWTQGDSAAAAYNFWNKQFGGNLAKYNITLSGNKIQHNGKTIFSPVSATRPRTTKQVLRNAIKKYGSIEKGIPVIEASLDATDAQALKNREFILSHSKDLLLANGKQSVIDFISILGLESDSALRLSGTLRGFENVKGNDFTYEHTPAIADLQGQIYDLINSTESTSDIIAGMRKILESSRVDLISDVAAKKLNDLGRKISGRDLSRYEGAIKGDIVLLKRNNQKAVESVNKIDLDAEFNKYLESSTGIAAAKRFDKAKAAVRGRRVRKSFGDYFVPPGAEDFGGLLHKTLAKGKKGEEQLAFYKKYLYDPFNAANESITREKTALLNDFKALKNKLSNVPKRLKEYSKQGDYTNDAAVRVFIWSQQGQKIPDISKADQKALINEVKNDKELLSFANELIAITKGDGYVKPENSWYGGNIATDLVSLLNTTKRSKHLEVWQNNVDQIFNNKNLNKLEAAYGKSWVENFKKTLARMKTGMNRKWGGDPVIEAYLDWVNGSVGAIMFLNTRSAVLQTISNVNYLNFNDNNPLAAAKAFANQPQYWSDFLEIFNSDYLTERRGGNKINVNESEIALAAKKGGIQGTISLLLNKGFIFTKIADSFAIASGGAPMYRNRINTYIKQGMSEAEAKEQAFLDFKAITEETQQSSRPDRISQQQASNAGRLLLAFANTPMQYNRIIKRNAQDLVDGRGDPKEKISKIIYYSTIQNLLFNALQKGLFALAFDDDDDTEQETSKYAATAEGMADSLLRGSGLTGNAVVAVKNVAVDIARRSGRPKPNFKDAAWKAATLSPPINNKLTKVRGALYSLDYVTPRNIFEPTLDNPALSAGTNMISATTNLPLDRALRKAQNIEAAMSDEAEWWQKTALLMGWSEWELGIEKQKRKKPSKSSKVNIDLSKYK